MSLEGDLHDLFAEPLDDDALRARIAELARQEGFYDLTPVWGPPLYRRNRVMFRPFIRSHFKSWGIPWCGPYQEALEQWLAEVDRLDDVELFRLLHQWKWAGVKRGEAQARAELLKRFQLARTSSRRERVLRNYYTGFQLDDVTCIELYEADPQAARTFLMRAAPLSVGQKLMELARIRQDDVLYFALYRRQVSLADWERDVLALCDQKVKAEELVEELEKRHPTYRGLNLGDGFYQLVLRRGRDVLPYLYRHLNQAWSGGWFQRWYPRIVQLALDRGWLDLWAALVRSCSQQGEFDRTVAGLIKDTALPETEVVQRLTLLATGPGADTQQFALMRWRYQLTDPTGLALYQRFPDLARGPYRELLADLGVTFDAVLAAGDEELLDRLAARALTIPSLKGEAAKRLVSLSGHYEALLADDPAAFARRAVRVLGFVPAYAIYQGYYKTLIRDNRLARLLFERTARLHRHEPGLLRDLLESPCIHVQVLALRVLGLEGVGSHAGDQLDLLLPMLLRPLRRATRLLAFQALTNAAVTEEKARLILEKAREALELPDRHYPREQLVGLMGRLLYTWPALAASRERPVVYTRGGV